MGTIKLISVHGSLTAFAFWSVSCNSTYLTTRDVYQMELRMSTSSYILVINGMNNKKHTLLILLLWRILTDVFQRICGSNVFFLMLSYVKDGKEIWGTLGVEFFYLFFLKNIDGKGIWDTLGDALRLRLIFRKCELEFKL